MVTNFKSTFKRAMAASFAAACLMAPATQAGAADATPLKLGVILPLSGEFAYYGEQIKNGIEVYLKEHGGTVAGRKIEMIYKDDTGVAPEVARRQAQQLLVAEKAEMLLGFALTPSALAAAPVATQAKVPMIVMNATSAVVPSRSPYIVRVSSSLPQVAVPFAKWAAKNDIKRVYTMVADYAPGIDTETAFTGEFVKQGGTIQAAFACPLPTPTSAATCRRSRTKSPTPCSRSCLRPRRRSIS